MKKGMSHPSENAACRAYEYEESHRRGPSEVQCDWQKRWRRRKRRNVVVSVVSVVAVVVVSHPHVVFLW